MRVFSPKNLVTNRCLRRSAKLEEMEPREVMMKVKVRGRFKGRVKVITGVKAKVRLR